jgi:hypothetical protein
VRPGLAPSGRRSRRAPGCPHLAPLILSPLPGPLLISPRPAREAYRHSTCQRQAGTRKRSPRWLPNPFLLLALRARHACPGAATVTCLRCRRAPLVMVACSRAHATAARGPLGRRPCRPAALSAGGPVGRGPCRPAANVPSDWYWSGGMIPSPIVSAHKLLIPAPRMGGKDPPPQHKYPIAKQRGRQAHTPPALRWRPHPALWLYCQACRARRAPPRSRALDRLPDAAEISLRAAHFPVTLDPTRRATRAMPPAKAPTRDSHAHLLPCPPVAAAHGAPRRGAALRGAPHSSPTQHASCAALDYVLILCRLPTRAPLTYAMKRPPFAPPLWHAACHVP